VIPFGCGSAALYYCRAESLNSLGVVFAAACGGVVYLRFFPEFLSVFICVPINCFWLRLCRAAFICVPLGILFSCHREFFQFRINGPRGPQFAPEENDFPGLKSSDLYPLVFLEGLGQPHSSPGGSNPAHGQVRRKGPILGGERQFGHFPFDRPLQGCKGLFPPVHSQPDDPRVSQIGETPHALHPHLKGFSIGNDRGKGLGYPFHILLPYGPQEF